jgi:uncharacterized Zn-binding protein involved in type VI secretion
MERAICRVGDQCTGTCNAGSSGHPRTFIGTWLTGSPDVFVDDLPVVRIGDTGITDCGHQIVATGGSTSGFANDLSIHRVGDAVTVTEGGTGVSTTGSPTTLCED